MPVTIATIRPPRLSAIDVPANGEMPAYNAAQERFEWTPASNDGSVGTLPANDTDSTVVTVDQALQLTRLLTFHTKAGALHSKPTVSTYALVYIVSSAYSGGVLAPNGDIHFVPYSAARGQKVSSAGVVSTYALVYTVATAYCGGVLAPNGDIHFVPYSGVVGQKVSSAGVVSTYALVYTVANAYMGGVLAPNGDIHFVPYFGGVGQKLSEYYPAQMFELGTLLSPYLNKL